LKFNLAFTISIVVILAVLLSAASFPVGTRAQTRPVIVAPGFQFNLFADPANVSEFDVDGIPGAFAGPTAMTFDARGRLFVATLSGKILILLDTNDDGRADQVKTFATGVPTPLGIEFRANGDLFATSNIFASVGRIIRLRDTDGDDVADEKTVIVDNLPSDGDHQTDKLKFGPDGLLYFGQGSATDDGAAKPGRPGERPLNAAMLRVNVDNPAPEVFATGLRNPFGMAFHPENGQLFSTDGGSGEICQTLNCPEDLAPPEEVNWVVAGGNYGFPQCEGTPTADRAGCAGVRAPVTQFNRHLTPTSIAFYTGPQAGISTNQMLVTLFKRLGGQGGDLRRFIVAGSASTGFILTEILPRIADFGIIDPFDGPVDTAIDPISGDIYVARLDTVTHFDINEHHHFIYRIHLEGSDALQFIGNLRPSSVKAGTGAATINLSVRHIKPGAVILANGVAVQTRQGGTIFDLIGDLPASLTSTQGAIIIEVRNTDNERSNQLQFSVTQGDPDPDPVKSPQITGMFVYKKKRSKVVSPVTVGMNAKKLRVVVTGADFDAGAQLFVGGTPVALTESSTTELTGKLTNSMVAAPGELIVQVRNSTGKTSNTVKLVVAAAQ
jgi:glucose/arabinose dehydrogenase